MAFEKPQQTSYQREKYNLYDPMDKREILAFEEELAPYLKKRLVIFSKELKGFYLYLHENRLFSYSVSYPDGAVNANNLDAYRKACMKYSALTTLWDMRAKEEEKERERVQSLNLG